MLLLPLFRSPINQDKETNRSKKALLAEIQIKPTYTIHVGDQRAFDSITKSRMTVCICSEATASGVKNRGTQFKFDDDPFSIFTYSGRPQNCKVVATNQSQNGKWLLTDSSVFDHNQYILQLEY